MKNQEMEIVYDRSIGLPSLNVDTYEDFKVRDLRRLIHDSFSADDLIPDDFDFYLLQNGRPLQETTPLHGKIHVVPRLLGGKGGFGSMLRAIGAQIEKTTNREACRDLSGRRLRDINEEKRLKKWIAEQAEREREAAERKKKKLERLLHEPKHEFSDPNYDKARSELIEKVHDAVEEGLKVATTAISEPVPSTSNGNKPQKKIKGTLWMDELEDLDSSDDSENEEDSNSKSVINEPNSNSNSQSCDSGIAENVKSDKAVKRTGDSDNESEDVSPAKKVKVD